MKGSDYGLKLERGDGCMYAIREDGEQWLKIEGGNEQTDRAELTRIVTAVNAHDDLVEALDGVVEFLEYHGCANYEEDTGACCTNNVDDWREYCPICKARAALAKAKGDTPDEG